MGTGETARDDTGVAPDSFVRARSLAIVMTHLAPVPALVLPFTLLVSILLGFDVESTRRAVAWIALAAVSCLATWAGLAAHRRSTAEHDEAVPARVTVLLLVACAVTGCVFGLAPFVADRDSVEIVLAFSLFPLTASAVAAVVTAGRRDLFLAFCLPLFGLTTTALLSHGDARLRSLGWIVLFYGAAMIVLHHMVSLTAEDSIRLEWSSALLLDRLSAEQSTLRRTNELLGRTNDELAFQASHDPLTGLRNRRGTLDELERLLHEQDLDTVALLFLDLDRFKAINDSLGHRGGDKFLMALADRIDRSMEPGCVAGRIGGDEFVVILPGHDVEQATSTARRLVGVIGQPVHAQGREVPSSASVGVAVSPAHGMTASELLRNANAALYLAKSSGRNRLEVFDTDMQRERDARTDAELVLRKAIDHGRIVPFFQPEIDAMSGQIVGAEMLARWVRADGTVVAAREFLELAEQAGFLERITERVMLQARPHIRRLASLGLPDGFRFRVNLAPQATQRSWRRDGFAEMTQGIDASLLTVDVHEAAVIGDLPAAASNLAGLRAEGVRICLDDFARGLSSLSLLRRLPMDEVRIDRSSIDAITTHRHDRAIVRSIIALVRELGLTVTAEGIEDGAQADALIALGVVRHQGHLYAPALPAAEFESFLADRLVERITDPHDLPGWGTGGLA
jgi:diguanylate cyclase (GGDEF)-like protein